MAKPEPPLKRSRKPPLPPPEENKGPRAVLKTYKESSLPGTIKKPVHPASFTFMGFHRGSGPGGPPSRTTDEGKTPGSGPGPKASASKAKEGQSSTRSSGPGPVQQGPGSPSGPKRHPGPAPLQRIPISKATPPPPSKTAVPQGSGLQPLNLQSKLVQAKDATGNGAGPVRSATKKPLIPPAQDYSPPAAPGRLQSRRNLQDKVLENPEFQSPKVQTRLEKKPAEVPTDRSGPKDGKKKNEMSAGEDESSSESDQDQSGAVVVQNQDWKPMRSLIEHVFVTDVTANLVTVTVKESPTSVGFFGLRNY